MRDLRDPAELGKRVLYAYKGIVTHSISEWIDRLDDEYFQVPDYRDETTIEKYGRPQDLPSTLPN